MGEHEEKKKASSLRGRVARSRQTYNRKSNSMPIIIGAVVLCGMGVGMYIFLGSEDKKYKPPGNGTESEEPANTSTSSSPAGPARKIGKTPKQKATNLCFYAKQDAKAKKIDLALSDLTKGAAANADYAAEIYFTMAMVLNEKIYATKDKAAKQALYREKVGYLSKAIEASDDGSKWTYGKSADRRSKVDEIMTESKKSAGM
jgi:hypothetical protein